MKTTYKTIWKDGKQHRLHRYLMEQFLGRKLHSTELVHHINGDKLDNRLENLEVTTRSNHKKTHSEIGLLHRFKQKHTFTKDQLSELYSGHTAREVAEILSIPTSTVYTLLKAHGIKRRKVGSRP